jgi:hypothetical protein
VCRFVVLVLSFCRLFIIVFFDSLFLFAGWGIDGCIILWSHHFIPRATVRLLFSPRKYFIVAYQHGCDVEEADQRRRRRWRRRRMNEWTDALSGGRTGEIFVFWRVSFFHSSMFLMGLGCCVPSLPFLPLGVKCVSWGRGEGGGGNL